MSNQKEIKELYSFNIPVEQEVEETSTKTDEAGATIKEVKTVKKVLDQRVVIVRPTRRQIETADLQFAVKQSEYIKMGILTKAMITKRYADTGGVLSESESVYLAGKYKELADLQSTLMNSAINQKDLSAEQQANIKAVIENINAVRSDIAKVESSYSNLFQHAADSKANAYVILWYTLYLTYLDKNGKLEPYFSGNTLDEKLNSFYEKEEEPDEFYLRLRQKLSYFISFWYNGAIMDKSDFQQLEKDIDEDNV